MIAGAAVRFPKIGIEIEHLPKEIQIFGIRISFYGILLACAMLCGLLLVERIAKQAKQNTERYLDFAIRAIIVGLLGARAGYVIVRWQEFKQAPAQIFSLKNGGLSYFGAMLCVLLLAYLFCKRKKLSLLSFCDTLVPGVLLGQIIGRWGDFFSHDILGRQTDGAFAMQLSLAEVEKGASGERPYATLMAEQERYVQVHPVFLYEILWNLGLLTVLLLLHRKKKFDGQLLYLYCMGYSVIRFLMEFFRADVIYLGDSGITGGMIVSGALFLGAAAAYGAEFRKRLLEKK